MPTEMPISVARGLRILGVHISTWRKLQRLPAATLPARADVRSDTLRSIERGMGTASSENFFRVLRVLRGDGVGG